MASNDQDSDGIIGSSTAGEYGVNDATSEAIFDVHSFLKEMDESLDKDVDHMKQFKKMVESLKEDQINLHTNDFTSETALHIAVRRGLVQATTILLTAEASVAEEDYMQCQPLHRACEIGNGPIVESLLKMGADIEALDCDKWTPLRWSASGGHMQVVELLLRSNANILAADDDGHTPFHVAADNGHTEMIEKFLQKNGSILNERARWGMTALHRAAFSGHDETVKFLLKKDAKVEVRDMDGWTPLMAATRESHTTVMSTLLKERGDFQANIADNEDKIPLWVAVENEDFECTQILLKHMENTEILHANAYQKLLSHEVTQEYILDLLKQYPETFDQALLWAVAKFDRHGIAKKLLLWESKTDERCSLKKFSAIELATQQSKPHILWWLIATSPRIPATTESVGLALGWLENGADNRQKAKIRKSKGKRGDKSKVGEDGHDDTAPIDENQPSDWNRMKDILKYPPIAQVYEDSAILKPPRLGQERFKLVDEFDARIVRYYKAQAVSSTIQRTRTVKDTVYTKGPSSIMKEASSQLKAIMEDGFDSKKDPKSSRFQDTYAEENLRFTYVHLPATNIDWMKDLLLRIMFDEKKSATNFHEVSSFLQSTWFEIPDRTSASRIMRPQFVERRQISSTGNRQDEGSPPKLEGGQKEEAANRDQHEGAQNTIEQETNEYEGDKQKATKKTKQKQDNSTASSALYMPFLSFSTQFEGAEDAQLASRGPFQADKRSRELIDAYKGSVHESATLDEAYYHFELGDKQSQEDRVERNRSQVVTKQLKQNTEKQEGDQQSSNVHGPETEQVERWPLLRVNQIWIWTIANKWVISATSHPVDNVEQSWINGFIEHLNKQAEAGGAQSQPGSTEDMVKTIVDYCVGFYERRRTYKSDPDSNWQTGLSIRQLFSNYINSIGRKETDLYDKFRELKIESSASKHGEEIRNATSEAKTLFSEIKDIRDELNILRSIANYQNIVQRKLFDEGAKNSDLAASYVVNDITEMDKLANRIQSAVDSTLTLQQSEIANFQAEESVRQGKESVKQGRILMAFTLVTILFLPMSFLTSLFALDVESFQKVPGWTFGVIFGVSVAFFIIVLVYSDPIFRVTDKYIFRKPDDSNEEGKQTAEKKPQPASAQINETHDDPSNQSHAGPTKAGENATANRLQHKFVLFRRKRRQDLETGQTGQPSPAEERKEDGNPGQ